MANDFIKILQELRGTGEPEAPYTDGIYYDIAQKPTEDDGVTPRLADGIYKSIQTMYTGVGEVLEISTEVQVLAAMTAVLESLYTDKVTLDSLYADKVALDSIYADKSTLDSLFADKSKLDSLYADKATLDSLFADKATLDSLFTDKATLDSLYADKAKLDSLYADKTTLDSLYADKATLDSLFADKATLDSLFTDKETLDSIYADKLTLDSLFADKIGLDAIYNNLAEILLADENATNASNSATQAQLLAWETEAERLTADSYATEAEDVPVNIVTSDGDGTFTYTPTSPAEYSSLHWAAKSALVTTSNIATDTTNFNNQLSAADDTVQKALDTLDNIDAVLNSDIGVSVEAYDTTILKDADIGNTVQAYDADTAKTDVAQTFTAPQRGTLTTDNDGSFDMNVTNRFKCTPAGNFTLTFTNIASQGGVVILDNSGGHTISADTAVKVSSTLLATISTAGIYVLGYEADGTNVYVTSSQGLS